MFPSSLQRCYASCFEQIDFLAFDFDLKKIFSFEFEIHGLAEQLNERHLWVLLARLLLTNQNRRVIIFWVRSFVGWICHHHRFDQFTGSVFPSRVNWTLFSSDWNWCAAYSSFEADRQTFVQHGSSRSICSAVLLFTPINTRGLFIIFPSSVTSVLRSKVASTCPVG